MSATNAGAVEPMPTANTAPAMSQNHSTIAQAAAEATTEEGESYGEESDENESDEDNGSDRSSQLSDGGELQDDLDEALDSSHFQFKGSFFHASTYPSAPNPCLTISELGLVGLPLSNRDASSIISVASLAPFGHGERTVVDEAVRHTWEIEPAKISFANEHWATFIDQVVCTEVCKSLGVTFGADAVPRMELYKLLLYEAGSHFLPHQDTQKADGMFATVIVVLPSAFTGGEVVLSHASQKQTIDLAPSSLLSTSILGWYTDVTHEVKAVTSGYRLALSYNLRHTSAGLPIPKVPEMTDPVAPLRRVLRKWNNGLYDQDMMVYLLDHQYSIANLQSGIKALKGPDALRVHYLQKVAEETDFSVGLAILEHTVSGSPDEDSGCYYGRNNRYGRRRRWGGYDSCEDDEDEEVPGMGEVDSTDTSITNLVDLKGKRLVTSHSLTVSEDCLIPREPFEGADPDSEEYEGYMGNYAGQVEHHYKRAVIVILPEANTNDLYYRAEGLNFAFNKLKESTSVPPTAEDRTWARRVLSEPYSLSLLHINTLIEYALKWNDPDMWTSAIKCPHASLQTLDKDTLAQARKAFGFTRVFLGFEELLARSRDLQERLNLVSSAQAASSAEEKTVVDAWSKKETDKIMASYTTGTVNDVPILLTIIKTIGLNPFLTSILPRLKAKPDIYYFWVTLYKGLRQDRDIIVNRDVSRAGIPDSKEASTLLVKDLMETCIQCAVASWSSVPHARLARILTLTEHLIADDHMELCKSFFLSILRLPGNSATNFPQLYVPLVSQLRALLTKLKRDVTTPVVVDLYQVLIGTYLRDILGKRGFASNVNLRKIGCGCSTCAPLDAFIYSKAAQTTFRVPQKQRLHLEGRLNFARDLCSSSLVQSGRPYGLHVSKLPAVVQIIEWAARQKAAQDFLASIGPDGVIAKIMGARYADVGLAISGTQQFGTSNAVPSLLHPPAAQPASQPAPQQGSSSTPTATQTRGNEVMNSLKRKQPLKSIGPVIDLTLGSP